MKANLISIGGSTYAVIVLGTLAAIRMPIYSCIQMEKAPSI